MLASLYLRTEDENWIFVSGRRNEEGSARGNGSLINNRVVWKSENNLSFSLDVIIEGIFI